MTGAEALRYARSRHSSTDFDRGVAPAARAPLAPRAGRPAGAHPAPARADQRAREGGLDRHPDRPARAAARARLGDRHQEHPLVRVHAAVLPEGIPVQPARLHHRPVRRQDPGRGAGRLHDRPGRRGARARSSPRRRAGVWVLNGTERQRAAGRASPATSSTTAWPPRRRARSRPARSRPNTTIVVYNGAEAKLPGHDRLPREDVRGDGHDRGPTPPSGPTSSSPIGQATPDLEAPPSCPDRALYSIGVSQWLYSGSRPRTASK